MSQRAVTAPDLAPAVGACCTTLTDAPLSMGDAERLAHVLKAVADPTRLRLLSLVAAHDGAEACVCDLTDPVALTQPTVSHHLRVLVDAGLLTREQRGKWAYYRVVDGALDALAAQLARPIRRSPDRVPAG
ncbi:MAG: transcriptional regulator [Pseudonocardiales bacterium]|nr:MAG: transcriptional regulator [Pseudonocardiales bacterium]